MHITLIAAMDENNGIGFKGKMPWHIPKDFQWFKSQTLGKPILMGRTCYEDIVHYTKGAPLPGRNNIVMTRSPTWSQLGFSCVHSVKEALELPYTDLFIIGGATLYDQFLPYAHRLILTHVHTKATVDTFFPPIDFTQWHQTYTQDDADATFSFTFSIYDKKNTCPTPL